MAQRLPYLYPKNGFYYVRLVVPKPLRQFAENQKGEILRSLGGSLKEVKANHARALVAAQDELEAIKRKKAEAEGIALAKSRRKLQPMTTDEIAQNFYHALLAIDEEIREADPRYAQLGIDDLLVAKLRNANAGKATDSELTELVGRTIARYRAQGNTTIEAGTIEWRRLARALTIAKYEALERCAERDEGDLLGKAAHPILAKVEPEPVANHRIITFTQIIDAEVAIRTAGKDPKGVRPHTIAQFRRVAASFAKHRKSEDATTVSHEEGEEWIRFLQDEGRLSSKTIGVGLVDLRTLLNWGAYQHPNAFPAVNPLKKVRKPALADVAPNERTFTMLEACTVLRQSQKEENPTLRYIPWITAYTGCRVSEVAALLKEDFFKVGDDWFFRVTNADGRTVKTASSIRRVPVHRDLVAHGLLTYVEKAEPGARLFAKSAQPRISEWMRDRVGLQRAYLAPNHSWRHLFEDLATLGGMSDDARSYITGRATRTSRDRYGRSDVALPGLAREMAKVPSILEQHP